MIIVVVVGGGGVITIEITHHFHASTARVGGGWMGFKTCLLRKMSLRRRATADNLNELLNEDANA